MPRTHSRSSQKRNCTAKPFVMALGVNTKHTYAVMSSVSLTLCLSKAARAVCNGDQEALSLCLSTWDSKYYTVGTVSTLIRLLRGDNAGKFYDVAELTFPAVELTLLPRRVCIAQSHANQQAMATIGTLHWLSCEVCDTRYTCTWLKIALSSSCAV